MSSPLVVRQLTKSYGRVPAVRGLDLSVAAGEVVGLLGPNGAGKTTTLECLAGLREPEAGEIFIAGHDLRRRPAAAKARLGAVLQVTALPDAITPREALALFASFFPQRVAPGVLLARFGLEADADRRWAALSGGQRQRLALALAFVNEPAVVLLDEPASGLDPQARRDLHEDIGRMRAAGCAVVLSTHDLAEAERLCDRVLLFAGGRVVASGRPRELAAGTARSLVRVRCAPAPVAAELEVLPGVVRGWSEGEAVVLQTADAAATLAAVGGWLQARGARGIELQAGAATLEQVFFANVGAVSEREGA